MGQYWHVLNINRRCGWESGKLGEFLFTGEPACLTALLRLPRKPKPYAPLRGGGRHSKDPRDLGQLDLPFDILDMIFENIPHNRVSDLVCLTMTNTLLLSIGQKWIYVVQRHYTSLWGCSRIICIGDYLNGDDLPPGLLKESEKKTLGGNSEDEDENGSRLYNEGIQHRVVDDLWRQDSWQGCSYGDKETAYWRLSWTEMDAYCELVRPDYSWDGEPETEWILCNLNTGEYVREDAVAELSALFLPRSHEDLTLGNVLLSQICWSSDDSTAVCWHGPLHRGRWAGHRFMIVGKDMLPREPPLQKTTWTDVTDQILGEVEAIWTCRFGPNTDTDTDTEGDVLGAGSEDSDGANKANDSADGEDSNDASSGVQEQKDTKEKTASAA